MRNYHLKTYNDIKPYDIRWETKILRIVEVLQFGEKIKTVLECETKTGKAKTVIYWGFNNAVAGDTVQLIGFLKDDRFIAKTMLITNRKEQK